MDNVLTTFFHNSTNLQDCQNFLILQSHRGEIIPYHKNGIIPEAESYHTIHTIPYQYNTIPWYGYIIHTIPYQYNTIPWYGHIISYHSYHTIYTIPYQYNTIPFIPYHSKIIPYHLYHTIYTIPFIPYHSNYHTIHRDYHTISHNIEMDSLIIPMTLRFGQTENVNVFIECKYINVIYYIKY